MSPEKRQQLAAMIYLANKKQRYGTPKYRLLKPSPQHFVLEILIKPESNPFEDFPAPDYWKVFHEVKLCDA